MDITIEPTWISALASAITGLSVIYLAKQDKNLKNQTKNLIDQTEVLSKQVIINSEHTALLEEQTKSISSQTKLIGEQVNSTAQQTLHMAKQNELIASQIAADHERSRKSEAIRAVQGLTKKLSKRITSARAIVDELNLQDCKKLITEKRLILDTNHVSKLQHALNGVEFVSNLEVMKQDKIELSETQANHLLYLCIEHLNDIEITLLYWLHGIADKTIIESELKYLVKPDESNEILRNLRHAMGNKACFPAIDAFLTTLSMEPKVNTNIQYLGQIKD